MTDQPLMREYVVTVPVHGSVTYAVEARNAREALTKVNALDGCGDNDDLEITWVGRARDAKETRASKDERGAG